jgi:hypothetical protein
MIEIKKTTNILTTDDNKTILAVESDEIDILTVSAQGPAGPPGPQGPTGPQGPQGPPGSGSGSGDLNYTHNQIVSSSTWSITHNLGKNPSVTIIDTGGNNVIGEISYNSLNALTLTFTAAFSGIAYLN